MAVESRNSGFDSQGRPVILFERHVFYKYTKGKYADSHPDLCNRTPGGYGSSASQWGRYERAANLDRWAANMATSWGLGQVMGFNHATAGYLTVDQMVVAMGESEGKQLDAAIEFIIHNGLAKYLKKWDAAGFAAHYNGAGYRKNDYDGKLNAARAKFLARPITCNSVSAGYPDLPAIPAGGDWQNLAGTSPHDENEIVSVHEDPAVDTLAAPAANPAPPPTQVADTIVNTGPAPAPPVIQDGPAEQVSNPPAARAWAGGGIALTILTSIGAWLSSHMNIVAVCVIGGILIVLLIICRSIILDWLRMHIAADPTKRNVK